MNRATGVQVRTPPRAQCRVASPERFVVCDRGSQKEQTMKRILVIAAVAAACGGSSGTAVDHNRAGSGSSTLLVTGTVTVTVSATAPLTSFSVTVKDRLGANASGATVTGHNSAYGDVPLTEAQTGSGVYTGSKTSYPSGDLSLSDRTSASRSEEHTSELQSPCNLVCRLLLEKKKK